MADNPTNPPRDPRLAPQPAPRGPVVPTVVPPVDPLAPHPVTGLLPERAPEVIVSRQTPEQVQGIQSQLEDGILARVHGRITEITGHSSRLVEEFEALRNKVSSLESRVNQMLPLEPNDRLATLQTQFDALVARLDASQAAPVLGGYPGGVGGYPAGGNPSLITRQVSGVAPQVVVPGVPTPVGKTQGQLDAERLATSRAAQPSPGDQLEAERQARQRAGQASNQAEAERQTRERDEAERQTRERAGQVAKAEMDRRAREREQGDGA